MEQAVANLNSPNFLPDVAVATFDQMTLDTDDSDDNDSNDDNKDDGQSSLLSNESSMIHPLHRKRHKPASSHR